MGRWQCWIIGVVIMVRGVVHAADMSDTAQMAFDARRTAPEISRNLFGIFTEHIGTNVYQGAWAQIVHNPEMVSLFRWPSMPHRKPVLAGEATAFGLADLQDSWRHGIAAQWARYGDVRGSLIYDGVRDVQRLVVERPGAGLTTGLYPPLHRTHKFELTLKARADRRCTARVFLSSLDGAVLGDVAIALTAKWTERTTVLEVDAPADLPAGSACLLGLRFDHATTVEIERVLLFPSDHVDGWEPEVVQYMKDAQLPLLRFPGGNFVSGYDWRDGIGPLGTRPTLPNPAWNEVEWNHVGTDEWLRLCALTGAEPMIC